MRNWGSFFAVLAVALASAQAAAAITPNDPIWPQQWGARQVNMPAAWDLETGDPSIVVALVDTGIASGVPDLQGALVPGWDFVDNDASAEDSMGHGTVSASIVAARGNNGQGIAGYCWRCRVMPVRVNASGMNFDNNLVAAGIRYAADHGARIISLGLNDEGASPTGDPVVAAAIAYAAQKNVLVIASAGNSTNSNLTWPAADPGAYAVAGTTSNDVLYPWSTRGAWIHLAAAGCQIVLLPDSVSGELCGNSTSAPAVSGIAGLLLSANPSLTPEQVVAALKSTAVPVAGIDGGRVDAAKALLAVGAHLPTPPPPPPPPPPVTGQMGPVPGPKMQTRVQRGVLARHRQVTIRVQEGRVAATLRSRKAKSCTVTVRSADSVWASTIHRRNVVSVAAKVPAGKYKVDVWCSVRRPSRFSLVLRAFFA